MALVATWLKFPSQIYFVDVYGVYGVFGNWFLEGKIVTIVSSKFLTCVHVVSALRVIHSWVDPHERRNIPIDTLYPFYWAIPRKKKKGMHCFSCLKSSKEAKEPKQSWKCWKGSSSKKEEDDDERTRKRKGRGICCFLRGKSCKGEEPLKKKGNKCRCCFFCFISSKDEPFRKRRRRCTGGACCNGSTKNKAVPEKEGKQGAMCCCFCCIKPSSEVPLEKRRKNGCCYKHSLLLVPKEEGKNMMSSNIHSSAVKNRMSSSLHSFEVVLKEGGKNRISSNIHSSEVLPKDEVKNRMSSSLHSSEVVPKDQVKNRMSSSLLSSEVVSKEGKNRMSSKIHSSELLPKDEGKSRMSFSLHSSQVLPKERKVRINSNLYSSEVLPKQEGKSKMNHDIHSSEVPSRKRRQCAKCCFPCSKDSSSKESSRKKGIGMCCFSCNKNSSKELSRKKDKCGLRCLFCNKESSVESSRKKEKCGICWFCCGKSCNKEDLRREKGEATNYFHHDKSTEKKCCVPCFKSSKTDQPVKRRERPTSKSPKGKSLKWRIRKIFFCLRCCSKKKRKINNKSSRKKVICWKRKEKKNTNHLKSLTNNISFKSESGKFRSTAEEILRIGNGISDAQEFTYAELAAATQNFKPENQLAVGGFGRIYKGELKDTKQVIAVKQLNRFGNQGNREFLTEVLMLSLLDHPNLIHLLGYCAYGDEKLIVYEYMPLGSLQDHLFDLSPPNSKPLDWFTRMKIGAGVAKGIQFMHEVANPPIIHRDLKPSNILLDEEFNPKLSDFGISKLGPVGDQRHVSTRVMGTCGYYAPEYALTGQLTKMSDIYSLGIVLLELITGRKAIDPLRPSSERMLVDWALPLFHDKQRLIQLADPSLDYNFPVRALYQAVAVAIMCIEDEDTKRPRIKDIVSALDYLTSPHKEHTPQEPEDPESPEECVPQDSQDPVVDPYMRSISEGSSHLSSSPVTDDLYMRSISEVSSHLAFRPVVDPYKRSISEDSSRFASNDWQSCSTIRDDESDMITIEL